METKDKLINDLINKIEKIDSLTSKDDMWNMIVSISTAYEKGIDTIFRRSTGVYYTNVELAKYMVDEMFTYCIKENISIQDKNILEPCVGIGNFIFSYLKKIEEIKFSRNQVMRILNNIYVADADEGALKIYKHLLKKFVYIFFKIDIDDKYFEGRVSSSLVFDINKGAEYIDIKQKFPNIVDKGGFDIVITNPPYKNLKAEKNKYLNNDDVDNMKSIYSEINKMFKNKFNYSNEGILNLFKIFIEEIICNYTKDDAIIGLLIPSTILTDKTCEKIRTMILEKHSIKTINLIPEKNQYLDAQQALCTLLIKKDEPTETIFMNKELILDSNNKLFKVHYNDIKNKYTGNAIFAASEDEYETIRQMRKFPVVKELDFIINLRGELDVTLGKKYIQKEENRYKLVRGKNIRYYFQTDEEIDEYVNEEFLNKNSKSKYVNKQRIACQQVVNIHKDRRISFMYVNENDILANSCNFLCVEENDMDLDLFSLMGIMNSTLINWLFKLTSSNNHVNNYEIDALPIPIKSKYLKDISDKVKLLIKNKDMTIIDEIDHLVYKSYGIKSDYDENVGIKENQNVTRMYNDLYQIIKDDRFTIMHAEKILQNELQLETIIQSIGIKLNHEDSEILCEIINKYKSINSNKVLNHMTFKLSELDLEMIKSVPQGGNWKNIPEDVIKKSKRLTKISQTGGRTTLYGRIDYDKPSYTITTYFNRPGNGTYVHPNHERVISVREAARLQSFKDDYYFVGNKSDLLKQVGNAVPPKMAFEIAKRILKFVDCKTSVDLFVGAGGMTIGFKEAGIQSIVANDFEKSACKTFKINNPEVNVICDDITDIKVKEKIYSLIENKEVDLICGGPPCQGFSHAGKRFIDDPRNQLFKDFIEVIRNVKPKVVVMENVVGMLTFQGGNVYKQILELFKNIGYRAYGQVLLASEYGVPQKRNRVIIICTREGLDINPEYLFPEKLIPNAEDQVTARDAIFDLEDVPCTPEAVYLEQDNLSSYAKEMRGIIKYSSSNDKYVLSDNNRLIITNIDDGKNTNIIKEYEQLKFII